MTSSMSSGRLGPTLMVAMVAWGESTVYDSRSVKVWTHALVARDPPERARAVVVLSQMGDTDSVDVARVAALGSDPDADVREEAVPGAMRLGGLSGRAVWTVRASAISVLASAPSIKAIPRGVQVHPNSRTF